MRAQFQAPIGRHEENNDCARLFPRKADALRYLQDGRIHGMCLIVGSGRDDRQKVSAASVDAQHENGNTLPLGIHSGCGGAVGCMSVDLDIAFIQQLKAGELGLDLLRYLVVDIAWVRAATAGHDHRPARARR